MARKIVYTDDYEENTDIEADAGTIPFALEGQAYEIDLSSKNATKLRNQLGPWIAKARKVGRAPAAVTGKKAGTPTPTGSGLSAEQLAACRAWAQSQGIQVSPKGRIPKDVILAWQQAGSPSEDIAV